MFTFHLHLLPLRRLIAFGIVCVITAAGIAPSFAADSAQTIYPLQIRPDETPLFPTLDRPPLTDIAGHSYAADIDALYRADILDGYPDGTFHPDQLVNRAEFTKILLNLYYTPKGAENSAKVSESEYASRIITSRFPDVSVSDWSFGYIKRITSWEKMKGYPDGLFRPAQPINYAEIAKLVVYAMYFPFEKPAPGEQWYQGYVDALDFAGARPASVSRPDQSLTRGEVARIVNVALTVDPRELIRQKYFPNGYPAQELNAEILAKYPDATLTFPESRMRPAREALQGDFGGGEFEKLANLQDPLFMTRLFELRADGSIVRKGAQLPRTFRSAMVGILENSSSPKYAEYVTRVMQQVIFYSPTRGSLLYDPTATLPSQRLSILLGPDRVLGSMESAWRNPFYRWAITNGETIVGSVGDTAGSKRPGFL